MKTKQHFIISVYERKYFTNRGGSRYSLALYENLGKGNLKRLGVGPEHRTGSHKGELSEGYTDLYKFINPAILKAISKAQVARNSNDGSYTNYYYTSFNERFGLLIDLI